MNSYIETLMAIFLTVAVGAFVLMVATIAIILYKIIIGKDIL